MIFVFARSKNSLFVNINVRGCFLSVSQNFLRRRSASLGRKNMVEKTERLQRNEKKGGGVNSEFYFDQYHGVYSVKLTS